MRPVAEVTFYPFQQKIHESKKFEDFSYNAFKQNAILINSRNLRHEEAKTIIFRRWISEAGC